MSLNNICPAVNGVGNTVLIIKDNKVIGKGRPQIRLGDDHVSISLEDDEAKKLIPEDHPLVKAIGYKHTYIRYYPTTGDFQSLGWKNGDDDPFYEDIYKTFEDTRIVDEFNFGYGMVPDTFKEVEGYSNRTI